MLGSTSCSSGDMLEVKPKARLKKSRLRLLCGGSWVDDSCCVSALLCSYRLLLSAVEF